MPTATLHLTTPRLEPWRVRELRAKTGTTPGTYVFEINVERGVVLKYRSQLAGLSFAGGAMEELNVDGDLRAVRYAAQFDL